MAHVQAVGSTGTSSGAAVTFPAFTAIGAGHCVVGVVIIHNLTNTVTSVTIGGVSATLFTGDWALYGTPYSALPFALFNIAGAPTTLTINFSGTPAGTDHYLAFDEYSGQASVDHHASVSGAGSSVTTLAPNITTTVDGCTIWTLCDPSGTPTTPSGFTARLSDTVNHQFTADELQATHGSVTATWTFASNPAFAAIMSLTPIGAVALDEQPRSLSRPLPFRRHHNDPDLVGRLAPPWRPFVFDGEDNPINRSRHLVFRRHHNDPDLVAPFIHGPCLPFAFDDQDNPRNRRFQWERGRQGDPDYSGPEPKWITSYDEPPGPRREIIRARTTDPDIVEPPIHGPWQPWDEASQPPESRPPIWRRRHNDPDLVTGFIHPPWLPYIFDDQDSPRHPRPLPAARGGAPDPDTIPVVAVAPVILEDPPQPARRPLTRARAPDPDPSIPYPWTVFAYDEPPGPRRELIRSRTVDPDVAIGTRPFLVVVEDIQLRARRLLVRAHALDLDPIILPPPPPAVIFVEDIGGFARRFAWRHPLPDADLIGPLAAPWRPFVFDDQDNPIARTRPFPFRRRHNDPDLVGTLAPPWRPFIFDDQDNARPRLRLLLRARQGDPDVLTKVITIIPPPVTFVEEGRVDRLRLLVPGLWRRSSGDPEIWLPPPLGPAPPLPLRTVPDGNWRSIIDPAARFTLPDLNTLFPQVGEIGFTLFLNTPVASSSQIADMTLVFVKPSGATLRVSSEMFVAGVDPVAAALNYQHSFVGYTFGPGELDEVGVWSVYLTLRGSRMTGIATFQVLGTIN